MCQKSRSTVLLRDNSNYASWPKSAGQFRWGAGQLRGDGEQMVGVLYSDEEGATAVACNTVQFAALRRSKLSQ